MQSIDALIPDVASPKYLLLHGTRVAKGGWNTKKNARDWITLLGSRLEWQVGFQFRIQGDPKVYSIVDRKGRVLEM